MKSKNELLLGVHLSTSKGIAGLFEEANRLKINVFQFFLGSPRVWKGRKLSQQESDLFLKKKTNYSFIAVHAPYLLNFASFDSELYERSINRAIEDIDEMEKVGIKYYVFHPGTNQDLGKGIEKIKHAIDKILNKTRNVFMIIENTAGERNDIGKNLYEMKEIIDGFNERIGICIDTCHLFASGINLRSEVDIDKFYKDLKKLGMDGLLMLIHANDSKFGVGQKRDRHNHIGEGFIGVEGFKNLLKHRFFSKIPYILETPKENDMDTINLEKLRMIWYEVIG